MNGPVTRQWQPELRRMIGADAVKHIDAHDTALNWMLPMVHALDARTEHLTERADELMQRTDDVKTYAENIFDGISVRSAALSTLRGRLRWLVTGKF